MNTEAKLRRKIRLKEACRVINCGPTQLRGLERAGHIRPRHPLWPGSRVKGFWEDEFFEDIELMDEKVRAQARADEEKRRNEIASGERRFGAARPRNVTSAVKPAPRPNTALIKRGSVRR